MMMSVCLDHLPQSVQQELHHIRAIVLEEFADAMRGKQAAHRKAGRILKLILHGGFARSDWYRQPPGHGFGLLAIVNHDELAGIGRHWRFALARLDRAWEAGEITHPVRLVVHSLRDINRALADGLPFFTAMTHGGIVLYELDRTRLATPRNLPASERHERGQAEFDRWYPKAGDFLEGASFYHEQGNRPMAALMLHQTCEHLYQCVTWTITLHGRRTHALDELRALAETEDIRLCAAWPRETRFERRCFARIRRAYVEVRYAPSFTIAEEELAWANERVAMLRTLVYRICGERLDGSATPTCLASSPNDGGNHVYS